MATGSGKTRTVIALVRCAAAAWLGQKHPVSGGPQQPCHAGKAQLCETCCRTCPLQTSARKRTTIRRIACSPPIRPCMNCIDTRAG
ncbi:MAG: hypothetical protein ACLUGI_07475 [Subdoligranulum sp.]